jgi:rhamnosyltransferase
MKVSIILVTYNPNILDLLKNILTYKNQTNSIVIVDNSDKLEKQQAVFDTFNENNNIHVITLGNNYGIAYAQNIGIKHAIENGYEYFIEMDQDSQLLPAYVSNIYNSYIKLQKLGHKIAGIGPIAFNKNDNTQYHHRDAELDLIEVEKTLSSGFLSSKEAIKAVGYKDEKLFIDLVDWEWCWRANSVGYKVFVDTNLKIPHLLGDGHKNFMFFKLGIPSPIRHYYQYRNALLLNKVSYVPLIWKIKRTLIHLVKPLFFLFFYNKKIERLKYIFKGIKDGIVGRSGRIS